MPIIIDASTIMAILLNEASKLAIIQATKGSEVVSPASLPWEVGNALSANVKRHRITLEQALLAAQAYQKIHIRLVDVDIEQSIDISNQLNIYAYDAYVLYCAAHLKAPLLCLDSSMIRLAKALGIKTIEVV